MLQHFDVRLFKDVHGFGRGLVVLKSTHLAYAGDFGSRVRHAFERKQKPMLGRCCIFDGPQVLNCRVGSGGALRASPAAKLRSLHRLKHSTNDEVQKSVGPDLSMSQGRSLCAYLLSSRGKGPRSLLVALEVALND